MVPAQACLHPGVSCRIFTLYSKSLPLDLACRVWDVFCRDGEEFLFRTALGLLRLYQDLLLAMDFIHMAQFLTRLPDPVPAQQLFQHIAAVRMSSRSRKWTQVGGGAWGGAWGRGRLTRLLHLLRCCRRCRRSPRVPVRC